METGKTTRRLFFALWPDATTRRRISHTVSDVVRDGGGRPVPFANLHLTLAFLGEVDSTSLDAIEAAGGRRSGRPFTLVLDTLGFWRRSRILWLGARTVPDALPALAEALWASLAGCGFEPEARAFHPHVTLARRTAPIKRTRHPAPIHWPVGDFSLVETSAGQRGSQYNVLATWALDARALADSHPG